MNTPNALDAPSHRPGPPLWLLAELTYRCPLHCVFCYNPVDLAQHARELSTDDWRRILDEARELGAVQCGFSGGEPLLRDDLEALVAHAHGLGYYTNLLTSGVGFTAQRADALKAAGLDHVQLSFQDSTREVNDFLSHTRTFDLKQRVAGLIKERGWPMVMNVVLHRLNLDHVDRIIDMAEALGAETVELANTQYYSWAWLNRDQLMPTREQVRRAEAVVARKREALQGRVRLLFVAPDYHDAVAKKCCNGWGQTLLAVTPDGLALPCHTARMLPGLQFPDLRETSVHAAWHDSEGFNRFRGTAWMKEPCRSCERREEDLGGCRCQAYLLTQDAAATDPVCPKSPQHGLVTQAVARAEAQAGCDAAAERPLVFREPVRRAGRQASASRPAPRGGAGEHALEH